MLIELYKIEMDTSLSTSEPNNVSLGEAVYLMVKVLGGLNF